MTGVLDTTAVLVCNRGANSLPQLAITLLPSFMKGNVPTRFGDNNYNLVRENGGFSQQFLTYTILSPSGFWLLFRSRIALVFFIWTSQLQPIKGILTKEKSLYGCSSCDVHMALPPRYANQVVILVSPPGYGPAPEFSLFIRLSSGNEYLLKPRSVHRAQTREEERVPTLQAAPILFLPTSLFPLNEGLISLVEVAMIVLCTRPYLYM